MMARVADRRLRPVMLAIAALGPGCPPPTAPGPERTLLDYRAAVAQRRYDRAYALLSDEYRAHHDRASFERALAEAPARAVEARRIDLRAEAILPDGERLPLVLEHGEWRIDRDPLDLYPQATPDAALRSFLRAVEQKRYDVLLRFVPARYRSAFTVEALRLRWEGDGAAPLRQELALVRAHLSEPLEISGNQARLTVGEHKQARLTREDGLWRVEALQ
jgi:hypothetical protein